MKKPTIPMSPDQLPQQRVYEVVGLPERPVPFDAIADYGLPEGTACKGRPRGARFLCQVEWAWSPMHNRISAYYLNRGRTHWSVWIFDPRAHEPSGDPRWVPVACVPRAQATGHEAAVHLLLEAWMMEKACLGLDAFHWISAADTLRVAELHAIATRVWAR